jgi:transposase
LNYLCSVINVCENLSAEAQKIIAEKNLQISELSAKYEQLQFQLDQLKRMIFGSKSERFIPAENPSQLSLEIDTEKAEAPETAQITTIAEYERQKKKKEKPPVRQPFPSHIPREIITIYPEGYDKNSAEKAIGKEVTEVLEEIPGKLFVKRYERLKFAKPENAGVTIGNLPSRPIEKGLFGEMLLARIIIDKYCDHLPLYRQQQRFQREGVKLAYSTIADVPKQIGTLLHLLYLELVKQVLSSGYLQADETPHPVLDSKVKEKTHRGFLWVYRSIEKRLVLFDYRKGRGKEGPQALLKNFSGFLQTDGYSVYEEFGLKKDIVLVGCMAHARRYFEKALDNDKERAEYFMQRIQQVYAVERKIKEEALQGEVITALRTTEALPLLQELKAWLKENIVQVLPQSPIGKAISYSLSRWKKLSEYIHHPQLEIDNNLVENAIRPTVLGRKNYLFSGSHEGAERAAMFYSFFGSCKMNGINPHEWLADVLVKISDTKSSELHTLLPNAWKRG